MNFWKKIQTQLRKLFNRSFSGGFYPSEVEHEQLGVMIDTDVFYDFYRQNSDIRSCVRILRNNVGSTKIVLQNLRDPKKEIEPKIAEKIRGILNSPLSREKTWRNLRKNTIKDWKICGNAFWHLMRNRMGEFAGIDRIDPRTISIIIDAYGQPYRYIQHIPGQKAVIFTAEEIIHLKDDEDHDEPAFGLSPIESVLIEAETDQEASLTNRAFFQNDAKPGAVYILDERLTEKQQKDAFKKIIEQLGGSKNRNKSAVLAGVKEIKTYGISQRDMEYLNGRRFNTKKICSAFGVPEFVIGWTENVNNNNGVELRKNLWELTISPTEKDFADFLNSQFLPRIGIEGVAIKFEEPSFETMEEVEKRAIEEKKNGLITTREYRQKTGKENTPEMEKIPNFDALMIHQGASAVLLEDVGVDPELTPEDEEKED